MGQGITETLYVRNLVLKTKSARTVKINVHTDSTAGKAIGSLCGAGKKNKHSELRSLYVQELVQRDVLSLRKLCTLLNCSDVPTEYLNPELLKSHLTRLSVVSHFFLQS